MNTLKEIVEKEGFELLGVLPAKYDHTSYSRFTEWLSKGLHGKMKFLEDNLECRKDLNRLLDGIKTVIVMGLNCNLSDESDKSHLARYARFELDYHKQFKSRGKHIIRWLHSTYDPRAKSRIVVDSAPIFERAFAEQTLSGFIGYNNCFIHYKYGSFILLAEILTTLELQTLVYTNTTPFDKICEGCKLCLKACPTAALIAPYTLDASKCLSYWTTPSKTQDENGPTENEDIVAKYTVGCDICQDICPYNHIK